MSEDKFKKIIEKYKSRYELNLDQFNQFLTSKVEVDSYQAGVVIDYIKKINPNVFKFSQEDLKFYINVIGAVQRGQNPSEMSESQIRQYEKIKFVGSKKGRSRIEHEENSYEKQAKKEELKEEVQIKLSKEIPQVEKTPRFGLKESQELKQEEIKYSQIKPQYKVQNEKLPTIVEERTDDVRLKQSSNSIRREFMEHKGSGEFPSEVVNVNTSDKIVIQRYEKTGQDLINSVFKYEIRYKEMFKTWRRYSEIEKLVLYLERKYEGVPLPKMPPKEGIKGGITQLLSGVDEVFLLQRKEKLQILLNRLLDSKIGQDKVLIQFLEDEDFQVEERPDDEYTYMKMLSDWKEIMFNAKEIKDYGMAYYSYVSDYKNKPLLTETAKMYEELQPMLELLMKTNAHRKKINENFDQRRKIMYMLYNKKISNTIRQPIKTEFDQILDLAVTQSNELKQEFEKYEKLKSEESWIGYLIKQKNETQVKTIKTLQEDEERLKKRIEMMEKNLKMSFEDFKKSKSEILVQLGVNMIKWRTVIHP